MQIQVVCCHPLADSYDHALFRTVIGTLEQNGHGVVATDLYREGFAPAMTIEERRTYMGNDYDASAVARYVETLKQVDGLILCFPHWWFSMPAMLKGWIDRVWGPGTAFTYDPDDGHLRPNLHNIKLFGVVTSYGSSWWIVRVFAGDAGRKVLMRGMKPLCAVLPRPLRHGRLDARLAEGLPGEGPAPHRPDLRRTKTANRSNQPATPTFCLPREAILWRKRLISLGLLAIVVTGCDPQLLIAKPDSSDYEVVALIAQ